MKLRRFIGVAALSALSSSCGATFDPNYCEDDGGCFDGDVCVEHRCVKKPTSPSSAQGSSGGSTSGSSSGEPASCDGHGLCGSSDNGCIACAQETVCKQQMEDCYNNNDCVQLMAAIKACSGGPNDPPGTINEECFNTAVNLHPEGFEIYNKAVLCAICDACPMDCSVYSVDCP